MGKVLLAICVGSLLLFMALLPGNHSEAEDAFEYSRLIEEGQGAELFHPHHLLYLPIQQGLFHTAQSLGYDGRSYFMARSVSMLSGALALLLFFQIALQFGRGSNGRLAGVATLGLLFSYGFVRYACEVEIYLPAMALALAAVYAMLRARDSVRWWVAGIVFAAAAVLMHTINAALAVVVIPVFYGWISRQWKRGLLHGAATLTVVGLVYGLIHLQWGFFQPSVETAAEGGLQPGTVGKALVGLGQCVLSANFIFAYETVAEKLQTYFPYRVFSEELFAASHLPAWLKAIAPITFIFALVGLVLSAIFLLFKGFRQRAFNRTFFVLMLWLAGTVAPTLILEPSNPELWILALAPLWLLFFWLATNLKTIRWVTIMVCLLGVHNLVVGMGSVRNEEGDYNFKKAEWVLQQAGKNDVLNTSESFVFTFYLNYWGQAEVRNLNTQNWKLGDTTYVFADVFNPPLAVGVRYPKFAKKVAATAKELQPQCRKVHEDLFGGIWVVEVQEPK